MSADGSGRAMLRLRAGYAVAAGAMLLFALPLYQAAILAPAGYAAAVTPAVEHRDLSALLAWIALHPAADRVNRLLQLAPFLLAAALPGTLAPLLWPPAESDSRRDSRRDSGLARVALWSGRIAFALFALAILVGLLTSAADASAYATARTSAGRGAAVASFAASNAVETLLAQVLGGLLLAVFLALVSRRMARAPLLFRGLGGLVAALAALNALLFLVDLRQVETPLTTATLFGLGLWLLGLGLLLPGIASAGQGRDQGRG